MRNLLLKLRSKGDFCAGGPIDLPNPGMTIDGVGWVSTPLVYGVAEMIKKVATQAPYGKGPDTLVDKTVRNAHQIEASKVSFASPEWNYAIKNLAQTVARRLGTDEDFVDISLYKVFLYEQGGHFKPHKDTEKEDGMFGTLVIQFPSVFTGGEFIVRHCGVERVFESGVKDASCSYQFYYTGHYADCEHEIKPILSGARLVAVYSLSWKRDGAPPVPPKIDTSIKLAAHLRRVDGCLGWILDHQYTPASLERYGCGALKGKDRAVSDALLTARDLMRRDVPNDELLLYIVRAQRIDEDRGGGEVQFGEPELDLNDGLHSAEGPRMRAGGAGDAGPVVLGALRSLRFFDDILNRNLRSEEDEEYSEDSYEGKMRNDDFWHSPLGGGVSYTGNEGGEGTKLYSCYVLALLRRARAFPLCCAADPDSAALAARHALSESPARAREMIQAVVQAATTLGSKALAVAVEIAGAAGDVGLLELAAGRRPLKLWSGCGGVFFVGGFTGSVEAAAFGAALGRLGRPAWDRMLACISGREASWPTGRGAYVLCPAGGADSEAGAANFASPTTLAGLVAAVFDRAAGRGGAADDEAAFDCLASLLAGAVGNPGEEDRVRSCFSRGRGDHIAKGDDNDSKGEETEGRNGSLREAEYIQALSRCVSLTRSSSRGAQWAVRLIELLGREPQGRPPAGVPSRAVADAVAAAVRAVGWAAAKGMVLRLLRPPASWAPGSPAYDLGASRVAQLDGRLRLACLLVEHVGSDAGAVGPLASAFAHHVAKEDDGLDVSAGLRLLVEEGGAGAREKAVECARLWDPESTATQLAAALAAGDGAVLASGWLAGVCGSAGARRLGYDLAAAALDAKVERRREVAAQRAAAVPPLVVSRPKASTPQHPELEAFLRGPEVAATLPMRYSTELQARAVASLFARESRGYQVEFKTVELPLSPSSETGGVGAGSGDGARGEGRRHFGVAADKGSWLRKIEAKAAEAAEAAEAARRLLDERRAAA